MFSQLDLPVVFYVFLVVPFAVSAVGIARWQWLDGALRVLVGYVTLDGLGTLAGAYLASKRMNNLWLTHVFTIVELSCFLYIFSRWNSNRRLNFWSTVIFGIFVVVWTISKLSLEKLSGFDIFTSPVEKMILMTFATLALVQTSRDHNTFVFAKASFWVLVGILVYCTGSVLLFAAGNNLIRLSREEAIRVWSMYWLVGSVANLSYIGGLLCRKIQ